MHVYLGRAHKLGGYTHALQISITNVPLVYIRVYNMSSCIIVLTSIIDYIKTLMCLSVGASSGLKHSSCVELPCVRNS